MCYLRQVKLEPQNRIYSNEALSGEKPRVLGTLVDLPLVADPSLDTDPPLVTDPLLVVDPPLVVGPSPAAGAPPLPPTTRKEACWRHSNLCSLF